MDADTYVISLENNNNADAFCLGNKFTLNGSAGRAALFANLKLEATPFGEGVTILSGRLCN
jgi:hypothetical protein